MKCGSESKAMINTEEHILITIEMIMLRSIQRFRVKDHKGVRRLEREQKLSQLYLTSPNDDIVGMNI